MGTEYFDSNRREFDLQPHPRILPMLGEISLPQWRCAAELIDNSVDGFLNAERTTQTPIDPQVHLNTPLTDSASAQLSVRDNGPGMSADTLANAVKAGWTGNDPINNLGLFGMGFNIATAKLGRVTTVWTVREQDGEWVGLRINFDELSRQGHFRTEAITRPKTDPAEHGTEVVVQALKAEQRQYFSKANNRSTIEKMLSATYSSMLRKGGQPLEFTLYVNGKRLPGWEYCLWSPERQAMLPPPLGAVSAFAPIDHALPSRPFCLDCWEWQSEGAQQCANCGSSRIVERHRRVYGWLGVQTYLHEQEYGIDLIRNGRKIELRCKDLFDWMDPDGSATKEYPIDDQSKRVGRIVGEIHLDHCRVSYMKDRFERSDVAWADMIRIVRGDGPLRPEIASKQYNIPTGSNTSPLFRLYQAFRRGTPYNKNVASCYSRILLVPPDQNDRAKEMASLFRKGDPQYQTDTPWWRLVEAADAEVLVGRGFGPTAPGSGGAQSDASPLPGFAGPSAPGPAGRVGEPIIAPDVPARLPRRENALLSRTYTEPATGFTYTIRALEVYPRDPDLPSEAPWVLKAEAATGTFFFLYSPNHEVFHSFTLTPTDALLSELAWAMMDQQRGTRGSAIRYATILSNLRGRYGQFSKIDPAALISQAQTTLSAVAQKVSHAIDPAEGATVFAELPRPEQDAILARMVTRQVPNAHAEIAAGRFLDYAPPHTILGVFDRHPELFFDGKCWEDQFGSLSLPTPAAMEQAQSEMARRYSGLLMDAVWLAVGDLSTLANSSRARLHRSALALDLITPDGPETGD